jgi:N-acetylneuraminic acid mutarotase
MKRCELIGKLPYPLGDCPGVAIGGWLYIFGGASGEELRNEIFRINRRGVVESIGRMPIAMRGHQAVLKGRDVYIMGGFSGVTSAEVFRWNVATGKTDRVAPMPQDAAWFTAVYTGKKILVVGGFSIPDGYWKHMAEYDTICDRWELVENAFPRKIFKNERIGSNSAVVHNRVVYSFGGADVFDARTMRANALSTIASFDLGSRNWTSMNASLEAREGLVSVRHGNDAYVVGGIGDTAENPSASIDKVALASGKITDFASLNVPRIAPAIGIVEGRLIVAGGVTKPLFEMTNSIEIVDVK